MDAAPSTDDQFLLEEGLEILALYRAIADPQVRLLVRQLIAVVADGQAHKP